jgi:hypothetical protein
MWGMSIGPTPETREINVREVFQSLHEAARRPFLGVDFLLIHYAEPRQIIDFLDQLLGATNAPHKPTSERGRAVLSRVLEAFDRIVAALGHYDVTRDWQHRPSREGPAAWKRLVDRPTKASLEILFARQDLLPEYLTRLWTAACSAGFLRVTAEKKSEIKVRGEWRDATNDDTSAWGLIDDEEALREVAKEALKALDRETRKRTADYLRPFRDLKKNPTEKRFRSALRRGDDDTPDFNRSMVQRAARCLELISDDLTDEGVNLIAVDPGHVRAVASLVCELFASRLPKKVQDRGFEHFGLEVCRICEELTGTVTYATITKPGARRPAEKRSGRGLNLVLAALCLIDPNTTVSQAQRVIDIHRGWRKQGTKSRVAKQRM